MSKVTDGLFTVDFSHLHYNIIQHVSLCEAILGSFVASSLDNIREFKIRDATAVRRGRK